jgi:hypothetical protein
MRRINNGPVAVVPRADVAVIDPFLGNLMENLALQFRITSPLPAVNELPGLAGCVLKLFSVLLSILEMLL